MSASYPCKPQQGQGRKYLFDPMRYLFRSQKLKELAGRWEADFSGATLAIRITISQLRLYATYEHEQV